MTFKDGNNVIGTATLDKNGKGSITVSGLSKGTHTITTVYGGSDKYKTSSSSPVTVSVN